MTKFYMVVGPAGKPVYAYNCIELDKATKVASKAAYDSREEVFIMTSTQTVEMPKLDATVTPIQ